MGQVLIVIASHGNFIRKNDCRVFYNNFSFFLTRTDKKKTIIF